MVIALAPRRLPAFRWSWLWIVIVIGLPGVGLGQPPRSDGKDQSKDSTPKSPDSGGMSKGAPKDKDKDKDKDDDGDGTSPATKDDREKTGVVDAKAAPKVEPVETFTDPRSKAALGSFKELFANVFPNANDDKLIDLMAGGGPFDGVVMTRYVQTNVARLTKKAYLQAMLDPAAKSQDARQIEIATKSLIKPLIAPANGQNAGFRRSYIDQLVKLAPDLLKTNHLFAREAMMIVLSESGDPAVVPVCIEVLEDADQLLQVKERAAVGIYKVARSGLITGKQVGDAAAALTGFFEMEPDAFYFVKLRVLEALGALRVASAAPARGRPEVSEAVLKLLADPKEKLDVRAYAGNALGMIQPGSIARYNYSLVASQIAQAAHDVGRRLLETREKQPLMANRLSVFLMMLVQGLSGDPTIAGSGIARMNPEAAAPYESKVKAVFLASLDYCRGVRSQFPARQKVLIAALDDLKATIEKKPPTDRALVPGGAPLAIAGPSSPGDK